MKVNVELHLHENDEECECELLDTSLSNVSEADCSCSDCLEAKLEAYNEFEIDTQLTETHLKYKKNTARSQTLNPTRNVFKEVSKNKFEKTKNESIKNIKPKEREKESEKEPEIEIEKNVEDDFKGIEEFMRLTQYRTRLYFKQRKELQKHELSEKEELKRKIKENLEKLKFSTKYLKKSNKLEHSHKWGHNLFSKCSRKNIERTDAEKDPHCKDPNFVEKERPKLDTNLKDKIADFELRRTEILEKRKEDREKKIKEIVNKRCLDECEHHPCKADPIRMKKIEKFISENAEKYNKKMKKRKEKEAEKEKIRLAKLRAIDIKCKNILNKTKKYDENVKSEFHLSIDNFSTFSDLRLAKEIKKEQKQKRLAAELDIKNNPQKYEMAIYEEFEEPVENEKFKEQNLKETSKYKEIKENKEKLLEEKKDEKDNKIKEPRQTNKLSEKEKREKLLREAELSSPSKDLNREMKKEKKLNVSAKVEKKIDLKAEIEKKKKELQEEYQKRNAIITEHEVKNKKIREQYEKSLKANKNEPRVFEAESKAIDPYRSNYEINANRNIEKIRIHGDPLIDEHKREAKIKKASTATEILFTANIDTLLNKPLL